MSYLTLFTHDWSNRLSVCEGARSSRVSPKLNSPLSISFWPYCPFFNKVYFLHVGVGWVLIFSGIAECWVTFSLWLLIWLLSLLGESFLFAFFIFLSRTGWRIFILGGGLAIHTWMLRDSRYILVTTVYWQWWLKEILVSHLRHVRIRARPPPKKNHTKSIYSWSMVKLQRLAP